MNSQSAPRGASTAKRGAVSHLRGWLSHHCEGLQDSQGRIASAPIQSFATALVMAVALLLPALLYVSFSNLEHLSRALRSAPALTAYALPNTRAEVLADLAKELSSRSSIASAHFQTPEATLLQFETETGLTDVLAALPNNPLPATLMLYPGEEMGDLQLESLQRELQASGLFDAVDYDQAWVKRLQAMGDVGERIGLALAVLLGIGALLVVGSTVGMAIEQRKDEIMLIKMIGGTSQYVQRPFLYSGALMGTAGGLLAGALGLLTQLWLDPALGQLLDAYGSEQAFRGLDAGDVLTITLIGAVLGWLGAQVAVSRHLWQIEPK